MTRKWIVFPILCLAFLIAASVGAAEPDRPLLQIDLRGDTRQAKQIKDVGWPYYRLSYFVENPRLTRLSRWATRAWNRANVRYKLQPTRKRSEAHIIIKKWHTCGAGLANIGYISGRPSVAWISNCSNPFDRAIATHELGHVLGLWHYGKCQLMSSVLCKKTSALPGRREKRLLRQMARNRDAAMRAAPEQPSIKIISPEVTVFDGGEVTLDFRVRMSANFADRFWGRPRITISSPDIGAFCDIIDWNWPSDEYGPWGQAGKWIVSDDAYCDIVSPEGSHIIEVSARSRQGTVVRDRYVYQGK